MWDCPLHEVALREVSQGDRLVPAWVVELDRNLAKTKIDGRWWASLGIGYAQRSQAQDHHWDWRHLVGNYRNVRADGYYCRCAAIQTLDGEVQGAMIYHLNGLSRLERGEGAIFINYLATAPWNRQLLLNPKNQPGLPNARYKGVGGSLVTLAALHSYSIGFRGRVTLQSLKESEKFYERQNFAWTGTEIDSMLIYELSSDQAMYRLASLGLI